MTKILSWNIQDFTNEKISTEKNNDLSKWLYAITTETKKTDATKFSILQKVMNSMPLTDIDNSKFLCFFTLLQSLTNLAITIQENKDGQYDNKGAKTFVTELLEKKNTTYKDLVNQKYAELSAIKKEKLYLTEYTKNQIFNAFFTEKTGTWSERETPFQVLKKLYLIFGGNCAGIPSSKEYNMFSIIYYSMEGVYLDQSNTAIFNMLEPMLLELCSSNKPLQILNEIIQGISPTKSTYGSADIIVIMEVLTADNPDRYTPITGKGATGVKAILENLREFVNPNYCLIPPVRLSDNQLDKESIAIFYNAENLKFKGPWVFDKDSKKGKEPASATAANYPDLWNPNAYTNTGTPLIIDNNTLPNRQSAAGATALPENQLAAQCEFNGKMFCFDSARPPVFCVFEELKDLKRTIKLTAMHSTIGSENSPNSFSAVKKLADVDEITKIEDKEVGVIVGDFNVFQHLSRDAYSPLIDKKYELVFDITKTTSSDYVETRVNTLGTYNLTDNEYLGYGYLMKNESLDNILVRYGDNAGDGYSNAMIVNHVTGVDKAMAAKTSQENNRKFGYVGQIITTTASFPSTTKKSIQQIKTDVEIINKDTVFKETINFGKIRETSDHMPLVITI